MTRRLLLLLALLVVAGCGSNGGSNQAATTSTTTSTSTTTTTEPDTAVAGCKLWDKGELADAYEKLVISRDERIVEAAKAYDKADDPFGGSEVVGELVRAMDEVRHACQAGGYLTP